MRARAVRVGGAGRGDRPVRHRSGRRRHLQHLDPGRVRRRGCRRAGRQARKPGGHQPMRLRRHHRGTRNRARSGARCGRAAHRRDRLRLHLRAVLPPGHEARHADPARAPDAHRVQPARPDQLAGRRSTPAAGRCGGTAAATPRRRAGAPRHGPRAGGALGRRARRAVAGRPESGDAGRGPDGRGDRDRPGRAGPAARAAERLRRRRCSAQQRDRHERARRRAGCGARRGAAECRRRALRGRAGHRHGRGHRHGDRRRSTPVRRPASSRPRRSSRTPEPMPSSVLDDLLAAAHRRSRADARISSLSELRREVGRMPPARRFEATLRTADRISIIAEAKRASPSAGALGLGAGLRLPSRVSRAGTPMPGSPHSRS